MQIIPGCGIALQDGHNFYRTTSPHLCHSLPIICRYLLHHNHGLLTAHMYKKYNQLHIYCTQRIQTHTCIELHISSPYMIQLSPICSHLWMREILDTHNGTLSDYKFMELLIRLQQPSSAIVWIMYSNITYTISTLYQQETLTRVCTISPTCSIIRSSLVVKHMYIVDKPTLNYIDHPQIKLTKP